MKKLISMVLVVMLVMAMGTMSAFAAVGDSYKAFDQLDTEKNDASNAPWKYMFTTDKGASFQAMPAFKTVDWGKYWYPTDESYTGLGVNNDVADKLELNVSDNNGEIAVLAFVAPNKGDFKVNASVTNVWEQTADKFFIFNGSKKVYEGAVGTEKDAKLDVEKTVSLEKGDVLYFYSTTTEGWFSAYTNVTITEVEAAAASEEPAENPETGDTAATAFIIAAVIALAGLVVFGRKLRFQ